MKKAIFVFTLLVAVSFISASKDPAIVSTPKELKSSGKSDVRESKVKSPEAKPRILFLISDDKRVVSSLWWRYDPSDEAQPGC